MNVTVAAWRLCSCAPGGAPNDLPDADLGRLIDEFRDPRNLEDRYAQFGPSHQRLVCAAASSFVRTAVRVVVVLLHRAVL